jgi:twitching motility two-component system response regulator PilG
MNPPQASTPTPKATILVVDDSATQRMFVAQALGQQGFRVVTAANGDEALQKLDDVDLIFMDINMPGMDGYQACKAIKDNPARATIPVIMLSGKDGFFDKMRGRMVGATDHVTKPCEPAVLLAAIEKYCVPAPAAPADTKS